MTRPPRIQPGSEPAMKTPFFVSFVLHLLLVLLAIFGLPHLVRDTEIIDPVPVEIVSNISELTTTNKPPVKAPEKPEKKPDQPPPKPEEKKPPPQQEAAKPPPDEALKAPPKPKDEKKPELAKKDEPKKPEKKQDKKPKKEDDKKKQEEDFDSLLKNLAADEPKPDTPLTPQLTDTTPEPSPNISRFSDVLSMSERDALVQQLSGCWNVMAGSANAENLAVEIRVIVNPDRTVREANIVDKGRYNSDTFYRAAADSALRALRNPRCTPLNLPPEKYSQWQSMIINFDPKDMF